MTNFQDTSRDREMILDPCKWPHLYLPLKRNVEGEMWTQPGVLLTAAMDEDAAFRVDVGMTIFGAIGPHEITTYDGVDALLADGWRVD